MLRTLVAGLTVWTLLAPAAPSGGPLPQSSTVVAVEVQYVGGGGAFAPQGGARLRVLGPAAGLVVQAFAAGDTADPPIDEAMTDAAGQASLALPPGAYWLSLPVPDGALSGPTRALPTQLPDGTAVLGWAQIEIAEDADADAPEPVSINVRRAVP